MSVDTVGPLGRFLRSAVFDGGCRAAMWLVDGDCLTWIFRPDSQLIGRLQYTSSPEIGSYVVAVHRDSGQGATLHFYEWHPVGKLNPSDVEIAYRGLFTIIGHENINFWHGEYHVEVVNPSLLRLSFGDMFFLSYVSKEGEYLVDAVVAIDWDIVTTEDILMSEDIRRYLNENIKHLYSWLTSQLPDANTPIH